MHPFCIIFRAGTECPKSLPNRFECIFGMLSCPRRRSTDPSFVTRQQCIRVPKCTRFASFFVPEPNAQKHSQTCSSAYLRTFHSFVVKTSTRVSLPANSAIGCRNAPVLHHFSCRNRMPKITPKQVRVHLWDAFMPSSPIYRSEFRYPATVHSGAEMHPFCIIFRAGTECPKTLPNMF